MKVVVVRHGQTDENKKGLINSRNNPPLNNVGLAQAEEMGEKLKDIKFSLVIASPLTRTVQTALKVSRGKAPIVTDERLLERDFGSYTLAPVNSIDRTLMWSTRPEDTIGDIEPMSKLIERAYSLLDELKERKDLDAVLLVSHGGTCKAICSYFRGIPKEESLAAYRLNNGEAFIFEIN